jgi:hypothetical protein
MICVMQLFFLRNKSEFLSSHVKIKYYISFFLTFLPNNFNHSTPPPPPGPSPTYQHTIFSADSQCNAVVQYVIFRLGSSDRRQHYCFVKTLLNQFFVVGVLELAQQICIIFPRKSFIRSVFLSRQYKFQTHL